MVVAHTKGPSIWASRLAVLAALLALVVGGLVLLGWAFDIAILKSLLPGWVSMKANTALCFALIGLALWFTTRLPAVDCAPHAGGALVATRLLGAVAGLMGLLTLGEYVFGWNPGLDQWLFVEPAGSVGTSHPGRMAPETALCFVALALALWLAGAARKTRSSIIVTAGLGLLVTALSLAAMLSYATPVLGAYGWFGLTIMAMHTAVLFALLGASVLITSWHPEVLAWSLGRRVTAAFMACVALLAIIGLNSNRAQFQLKQTQSQVALSEELLGGTSNLLFDVLRVQSHTRGYVITGDVSFLTHYTAAKAEAESTLTWLGQLLAQHPQHPQHQQLISQLDAPVKAILQWFQQEVDARHAGVSEEQRQSMVRQGEALLKNLTDRADQIEAAQRQHLAELTVAADNVSSAAYVILFAGTLLSLLIFLAAVLRLNGAENARQLAIVALRESEENLTITLHSIGDAVIATDPTGAVTRMNQTAERLCGWTLAEAVGRPMSEVFRIVNAVTRQPVADPVQLVMARGQVVGLANHTALLARNGQEYQIADSAAPIRNTVGVIVGVVLVFSDVTEAYRVQEALRVSEERYRNLVEDTQDLITQVDPQGRFTFVNGTAQSILGLTGSQCVGLSAFDFVHPQDRNSTEKAFGEWLQAKLPRLRFENRQLSRSGAVHLMQWDITATYDGAGNIIGFNSLGRDVTQMRQAEQAIRTSEQRFRDIVNTTDGIVWEADAATFDFTFVSQKAQTMLGFAVEDWLQPGFWLAHLHPDDRLWAPAYCVACTARMEPHDFEYRFITQDDRTVWLRDLVTVVSEDGKPRWLRGIMVDVTARKLAEDELKRSNAELEQFSYSISHDLRQPLRMISSYMQLLERGLSDQLDAEKRKFFDFAIDGARRMDAMMLGLLDYSRVGRKGEPLTRVDSRRLLDEALLFLRAAAAEAHAQIEVLGDWPMVRVSPDEVMRLLQNLIANAIKYRIAGRTPEIVVRSQVSQTEWQVVVSDDGIGILPDQMGRLFQVFQRLQSRAAYEGTGIGLALCRKIVQRHHGRIWVESGGEGQGSCFSFCLPLLPESAP